MNAIKGVILLLLVLPICFAIDSDRDGISDTEDAYPYDFDNDGMTDSWESLNGLRYDVIDSHDDPDNDGLSNLEEFDLGSDPHSIDSDGDSVSDYKEHLRGTDPLSKDRIVWPFIVVPILIILFIGFLVLSVEHHFDIFLKELLYETFI